MKNILRSFAIEAGTVTKLRFNYKEVENGENLDQNIVLQRGDTIVVP